MGLHCWLDEDAIKILNLKLHCVPVCLCLPVHAGMSVILMQLPAVQDILALRNLQAANGDLQLWLLPK